MRKTTQTIVLTIAICIAVICTACSSTMRSSKVYENDYQTYIVIGEDTLTITDQPCDSLCIAREINTPYDGEKWLLQLDNDGQYSVLLKGNGKPIYSIMHTDDFVMLGEDMLYHISERKKSATPHGMKFIRYLGVTDGKHAFMTGDTVCFSDGRRLCLRKEVICDRIQKPQNENHVRLCDNAQSIVIPLADIYAMEYDEEKTDEGIRTIREERYVETKDKYTGPPTGCDITVEYPTGNFEADNTMRNMLLRKMTEALFIPLESNGKTIPVFTCRNADEFAAQADKCIGLWEKMAYKESEEDSEINTLALMANFRRIADNEDYSTYWFYSSIYTGGAHGLQSSYYLTYDKHNHRFLTIENMIKKEEAPKLRRLVMDSLCDMYIERHELIENGTDPADNNQQDSIRRNAEETILANANGLDIYPCDKKSDWQSGRVTASVNTLPLPHFALLPEGIVVSYHQYQIDAYAFGEYHVVVPYEKIPGTLIYDYSDHTDEIKGISHYIKRIK